MSASAHVRSGPTTLTRKRKLAMEAENVVSVPCMTEGCKFYGSASNFYRCTLHAGLMPKTPEISESDVKKVMRKSGLFVHAGADFLKTLRNTIARASSYVSAARFLIDAFEEIGTVDGKVQLMTPRHATEFMVFANSAFAGRGETDAEKRVMSNVVVRLCYAPWLLSFSDNVFISDSICYLGNAAQPPRDTSDLARLLTQFKDLRKDSLNRSTWYPRDSQ
jgi:hypothetical protein